MYNYFTKIIFHLSKLFHFLLKLIFKINSKYGNSFLSKNYFSNSVPQSDQIISNVKMDERREQ